MEPQATRYRVLFAAVGLVQGVAYWWLGSPVFGEWMPSLVLLTLVTTTVVTIQYAWDGRHVGRLLTAAAALATPTTLVAWWVLWQATGDAGDNSRVGTWSVGYWVTLYVLMPFAQVWVASGGRRFPYPDLFRHSWNNFFIGFVACTFTAVFWALIGLWAGLFKVVGVSFFADVFFTRAFASVATPVVTGAGIAIGRETDTITNMLRRITLAQFRALMPIVVTIVLLFLGTLPMTGVEPLWATRHASPLLFGLIGAMILFLNAVVQDGSGEPLRPLWFRRSVEAAVLGTPVLCGLLFWAIGLRIAQHGLTPDRFYVVVFAGIATLYAVGYAAAVLRPRERWLGLLRTVNVRMALVVAALALALHTPALDPLAWSARNQLSRVLDGVVPPERFDYTALAGLGRVGRVALGRLATLDAHPKAEAIRRYAGAAQAGTSLSADRLRLAGSIEVPSGLLEAVAAQDTTFALRCANHDCTLFTADIVSGGEVEYCLLTGESDLGCWEHTAQSHWNRLWMRREGSEPLAGALRRAVDEGHTETVPPPVRDLRIGETTFRSFNR